MAKTQVTVRRSSNADVDEGEFRAFVFGNKSLDGSEDPAILDDAGDAGLVADPNDVDAISAHILQSLQDDSWREVATARGLAQAKQFSWENCTTQTINAYKLL